MKSIAAAVIVAGASAQFATPYAVAPFASVNYGSFNPYSFAAPVASRLAAPVAPAVPTANSAKAESKLYKVYDKLLSTDVNFGTLGKYSEFQSSALDEAKAIADAKKITGDDYDADKMIDAQLKLQAASGYKNRMVMEAFAGQSYKNGGNKVNTAGVLEWSSKQADAQLAQRKYVSALEKGDEKGVVSAQTGLAKANYKLYAQLMFLMGKPDMAKLYLMKATEVDVSAAQEGLSKATEAYHKDPSTQNMHKLRLAELKAGGVKADHTTKMVDYMRTTNFAGSLFDTLGRFTTVFDYQAAKAKVDIDNYNAVLKAQEAAAKAQEEAAAKAKEAAAKAKEAQEAAAAKAKEAAAKAKEAAAKAPSLFAPAMRAPYFVGGAGLPMATMSLAPAAGLPMATRPLAPAAGLPMATRPLAPAAGLPMATRPLAPAAIAP